MKTLSYILIPFMILGILIYAFYKKTDIYSSFIEGAKEGIESAVSIFPFTVSMVFAVNIFLHSGVVDKFFSFITPYMSFSLPTSLFPMALLRPISGSASMVIMTNIFNDFGPDSFAGRLASTIQGSTDTTLYVISLYFGSIGINKIRYSLKVGLFADLMGIIASVILCSIFF